MKYPLSLIKKYVSIDQSATEVGDTLTSLGCEVEEISNTTFPFTNVVIGKILSIDPHPNADSLRVLKVSVGKDTKQIICGDPSAQLHDIVAVALDGSTLPGIKIKQTKLRGVESQGMLPSEHELGIGPDNSTIYTLPSEAPVGTPLNDYLYDPTYTIGFTPNLGYARSARGLARELAAHGSLSFNDPEIPLCSTNSSTISLHSDCDKVTQFVAQKLTVSVKPSPYWLKRALQKAGLRSINTVVDVTNYVLLLLGQPMHAFDADSVPSSTLCLTTSQHNGSLATLDDQVIDYPKGVLLITDKNKHPLSFAGVMGGKDSSVTESTKTIILEAGTYCPSLIRKSSKLVGIRTDASSQFEQGTDPNLPYIAVNLASTLLQSMGAEVKEKAVGLHNNVTPPHTIHCNLSYIQTLLGTPIPQCEVTDIFSRLGFIVSSSDEEYNVKVPAFRNDLTSDIDLVEEVARIYGYNNIPHNSRKIHLSLNQDSPQFIIEQKTRSALINQGLQETIYCSLIDPKYCEKHGFTEPIKVMHPKSNEQSVLRPTLLFGQLNGVLTNRNVGMHNYHAFEIGRIHFYSEGKPQERLCAAMLLSGEHTPYHHAPKPQNTDFFDLKGHIEELFLQLTHTIPQITPSKEPLLHPNIQAQIQINNSLVGCFGQVHPEVAASFDLQHTPLFFAHIDLEVLSHLHQEPLCFSPPIKYPSTTRDATLTLKEDTSFASILDIIQKHGSPILKHVFCLDVYRSPSEPNQKKLTIRFIYQDPHKTLKDQYVEKTHMALIKQIEKNNTL